MHSWMRSTLLLGLWMLAGRAAADTQNPGQAAGDNKGAVTKNTTTTAAGAADAAATAANCRDLSGALSSLTQYGGFKLSQFEELLVLAQEDEEDRAPLSTTEKDGETAGNYPGEVSATTAAAAAAAVSSANSSTSGDFAAGRWGNGTLGVAATLTAGTQPWTVFAPTDGAFDVARAAMGLAPGAALDEIDPWELEALLAYAVVPEPVKPFGREGDSAVATLLGPTVRLVYATNMQGKQEPTLKYLLAPATALGSTLANSSSAAGGSGGGGNGAGAGAELDDVNVAGFLSVPLCSGGYVYVVDNVLMP